MYLDASHRLELQAQLKEARAAQHRLMTGESVREFVDQNGERISYSSANASALAAYIWGLENKLGLHAGGYGPLGYFF